MRARFICVCFGVLMVHAVVGSMRMPLRMSHPVTAIVIIAGIVTDEEALDSIFHGGQSSHQMRENL